MRILVTGGAGYIGSHTTALLLCAGHEVVILDDFSNAERDVPDRIAEIAGKRLRVIEADITRPGDYAGDVRDTVPEAAIHFAGLKAVSEAMADPLLYWRVNVGGSACLFAALSQAGCRRLVFSSSATVYGVPEASAISEEHPVAPENPYGETKAAVERMIADWARADPMLSAVSLRYFNPVGAHPSSRIGEAPSGVPQNLMPFVADVAAGRRDELSVFGDDWDTPDGTGVRDYIHVMDLAEAHLAALGLTATQTGTEILNIGTGRGYSVLEMIRTFENVTGCKVPYKLSPRRPGDVAFVVSDPSRANTILNWHATRDLDAMCRDAWAWSIAREELEVKQQTSIR